MCYLVLDYSTCLVTEFICIDCATFEAGLDCINAFKLFTFYKATDQALFINLNALFAVQLCLSMFNPRYNPPEVCLTKFLLNMLD